MDFFNRINPFNPDNLTSPMNWNPESHLNPWSDNNPLFGRGGVFGRKPGGAGVMNMNQPAAPNYIPSYDPRTMEVQSGLEGRLSGAALDERGLNQFRREAMRQGPSAWSMLANDQQRVEEDVARQRAGRESAGSAAEARSQLAQQGGLTSGARERIARDSGRNYLGMSQNIAQQGNQNRMQIGVNDEQNRISQLGALPSMDVAASNNKLSAAQTWAQGRQFDVQNRISEGNAQNLFNANRYNQQMGAWGANQQANATAQSGKK